MSYLAGEVSNRDRLRSLSPGGSSVDSKPDDIVSRLHRSVFDRRGSAGSASAMAAEHALRASSADCAWGVLFVCGFLAWLGVWALAATGVVEGCPDDPHGPAAALDDDDGSKYSTVHRVRVVVADAHWLILVAVVLVYVAFQLLLRLMRVRARPMVNVTAVLFPVVMILVLYAVFELSTDCTSAVVLLALMAASIFLLSCSIYERWTLESVVTAALVSEASTSLVRRPHVVNVSLLVFFLQALVLWLSLFTVSLVAGWDRSSCRWAQLPAAAWACVVYEALFALWALFTFWNSARALVSRTTMTDFFHPRGARGTLLDQLSLLWSIACVSFGSMALAGLVDTAWFLAAVALIAGLLLSPEAVGEHASSCSSVTVLVAGLWYYVVILPVASSLARQHQRERREGLGWDLWSGFVAAATGFGGCASFVTGDQRSARGVALVAATGDGYWASRRNGKQLNVTQGHWGTFVTTVWTWIFIYAACMAAYYAQVHAGGKPDELASDTAAVVGVLSYYVLAFCVDLLRSTMQAVSICVAIDRLMASKAGVGGGHYAFAPYGDSDGDLEDDRADSVDGYASSTYSVQ